MPWSSIFGSKVRWRLMRPHYGTSSLTWGNRTSDGSPSAQTRWLPLDTSWTSLFLWWKRWSGTRTSSPGESPAALPSSRRCSRAPTRKLMKLASCQTSSLSRRELQQESTSWREDLSASNLRRGRRLQLQRRWAYRSRSHLSALPTFRSAYSSRQEPIAEKLAGVTRARKEIEGLTLHLHQLEETLDSKKAKFGDLARDIEEALRCDVVPNEKDNPWANSVFVRFSSQTSLITLISF